MGKTTAQLDNSKQLVNILEASRNLRKFRIPLALQHGSKLMERLLGAGKPYTRHALVKDGHGDGRITSMGRCRDDVYLLRLRILVFSLVLMSQSMTSFCGFWWCWTRVNVPDRSAETNYSTIFVQKDHLTVLVFELVIIKFGFFHHPRFHMASVNCSAFAISVVFSSRNLPCTTTFLL